MGLFMPVVYMASANIDFKPISSLFCRFLAYFYRLFGDFGAAAALFPNIFTFLNRPSWCPSTLEI